MNRNKIIVTVVLLLLGVFFVFTTCYRGGEKSKAKALPPGFHGVSVTEIIQTSSYTYLQVEENNTKFWIAVVKREAKPGDSIYYSQAYEMKDFVSKELGRTFPSVFFVQDPVESLVSQVSTEPLTPKKVELKRWSEVTVDTPKGGITIAELYKNPGNYSGKSVIIRGTIVKYNPQIMNKNWVHIQDGTENEGKFDLTVTTSDSLVVGTQATFKGIIALNKDFGSGYFYEVIMEQARATDVK
jgi:hypothetical protein